MPLFMAINDIVSNLKRYIVLILTFTIGLLIIIFPVNTISTLKSEEMAKNFSFDTKSDFLIKSDSVQQEFDDLQRNLHNLALVWGGFTHVKEGRESSNVCVVAFVLLRAVFVVVAWLLLLLH